MDADKCRSGPPETGSLVSVSGSCRADVANKYIYYKQGPGQEQEQEKEQKQEQEQEQEQEQKPEQEQE